MTNAFDDRLVTFEVTISGKTYTYNQDYYIVATGTRFVNGNFGECVLRLDNISKATRNEIISKTTPWATPRQNAQIVLSVGRKSYGTFELFRGDMIASNVTQPPDIGLTFKSALSSSLLGYTDAFSAPPSASFLSICQQVTNNINKAAPQTPIVLDFQSSYGGKTIGNFSFTGPVMNEVRKLEEMAPVNAFIESGKLVVLDIDTGRNNPTITISSETGMIGVPEITEYGVSVRFLMSNNLILGSLVNLISKENPQANGIFKVFKLQFEIASRDTPFYWVIDLRKPNLTLTDSPNG